MGLRTDSGIVEASEDMEVVGETGCFLLAAVEGLRSWAGDGWRFREADWIAEAMSTTGSAISVYYLV